ncbi:MAG: dTDP-4-dehydrorhamnose 3,5-epimerase [Candidatus Bathyarchaeia archaeon]
MRFTETPISGAWIIDPERHNDDRGYFVRAWCTKEFSEHGINFTPVQANMGFSIKKGTLRGMHFQKAPAVEAKLVRCTKGSIFDVVVDVRPESATFGKWFGAELTAENGKMLYVPEECAHGYQTLEDNSEIYYLTSGFYAPKLAFGARYNDPLFNIKWPSPVTVISEQDRNWPLTIQGRKE